MQDKKSLVISLGGSLIVPDEINVDFLKDFVSLVNDYTKKGFNFLIITGGGKICRKYNDSLRQITNPSNDKGGVAKSPTDDLMIILIG